MDKNYGLSSKDKLMIMPLFTLMQAYTYFAFDIILILQITINFINVY